MEHHEKISNESAAGTAPGARPVAPDMCEAARLYRNREQPWYPVPLRARSKASSLKNWPGLRLGNGDFDRHFSRDANIGLLLGEVSGNLTDIDLDCAEAVLAAQILLPDTPMKHGRPSSPTRHYWYVCDRASSTVRIKGPDGACIAELRSGTNEKASYTMVPPSVHPDTGEIIAWEGPLEPAEVPYDDLLNALREVATAALVAQFWKQGSRHEFALALAGYFAFGGVPEEKACRLMTAISHASGDTELQDRLRAIETTYRGYERGEHVRGRQGLLSHLGESAMHCLDNWLEIRPVKGIVKNPGRSQTPNPADAELTDLGNAKRFVVRFGADIRYVPAWGWMYWDENRWAKDELGRVRLRVCEMIQEMAQEAERMARIDDKIRMLKWTHQSQSNARLNAVLEIAAYQEPVVCHSSCFDTDPWAFNVQNGTIDLEYGTIRPHRPTDYFSKVAPVKYYPLAPCPYFDKFLDRIFAGDDDLIHYVQKVLGYTLIGGNPEQILLIFFGHGANGKSVLLNTVMDILGGDYSQQMNASTILESRDSGPRNDLASLQGVRLAAISETGERSYFNEPLIKQMTGGERIRARFLYKEEFEFTPQFTVVLSTNHKPHILDNGHGIWRRIRLIPFDTMIPREEQDPDLRSKLLREKEGILAWLIRGCLSYLEEGLNEPQVVLKATSGYRQEMDTLGEFLSQCTQEDPLAEVKSQEVYDAYREWCDEMGLRPVNQMKFTQRMESRGYERTRRKSGIWWKGLRLDSGATNTVCFETKYQEFI